MVGDVIFDSEHGCEAPCTLHDIEHPLRAPYVPAHDHEEELLTPIMEHGVARQLPGLEAARARAHADLEALSVRTKRFLNPQPYPVGLDGHVHRRKLELIAEARAKYGSPGGRDA